MIPLPPLFPIQAKTLLGAATLGLMAAGSSLHAAVIADFSGGAGTSTPDQFEGTSGSGWSAGWLKQNGSSGSTTFDVLTPSDPGYAPLNSGGNYLQIDYQRTSAGGTIRAGVAREFDIAGAGSMDLNNPYETHFTFRLDQLTGFSSSADQILFSTENTTTISSSQAAAPWYLWLRGDEGFSVLNGDGVGGAGRVRLSSVPVQTGVVYSVSVYLDPATFTYDLTIDDGTTLYRASEANGNNPLGFRTNTLANQANVLQARMVNDAINDQIVVSLDHLSVIPEPGSVALLGSVAGLLSLLHFRRRSSLPQ